MFGFINRPLLDFCPVIFRLKPSGAFPGLQPRFVPIVDNWPKSQNKNGILIEIDNLLSSDHNYVHILKIEILWDVTG